jgi:hypothetical protein
LISLIQLLSILVSPLPITQEIRSLLVCFLKEGVPMGKQPQLPMIHYTIPARDTFVLVCYYDVSITALASCTSTPFSPTFPSRLISCYLYLPSIIPLLLPPDPVVGRLPFSFFSWTFSVLLPMRNPFRLKIALSACSGAA